jgi:hypothetical protein
MSAILVIRTVQAAEAQATAATTEGRSMSSSALLCAQDARRHYEAGRRDTARMWALRSLSYSVGVFSPVYKALAT